MQTQANRHKQENTAHLRCGVGFSGCFSGEFQWYQNLGNERILWEAATGTLFSGDAIYDGPLLYVFGDSNIDDYIRTLERLRELPVTVVHGGHDPSFGRERMIEICDTYLEKWGAA